MRPDFIKGRKQHGFHKRSFARRPPDDRPAARHEWSQQAWGLRTDDCDDRDCRPSGTTARLRHRGRARTGGGLLLISGYRVRIVAITLALFCIATAISFHNNFADKNQMIHFLKNVMMAGGLLQIAAFGAGRLSLDHRFSDRS
jgi:hypothetical protein